MDEDIVAIARQYSDVEIDVFFESSEEALKSICSICGGKIGQRKDDTPEGIHKRFQVFQEETRPVIEKFESEGLLFRVSGNQTAEKTSEEIFQKIGGSDS